MPIENWENNYPEIAINLATSGRYDLVCYGHDHSQLVERVGDSWLVNPGEMMGRFGQSTYIVFDIESRTATVRAV